MTESMKRMKRECSHIRWVAEHPDLYEASGEGIEILKDLQRYGQNVYTYTQEAIRAYARFLAVLCGNPYRYMAGEAGEEGSFCIAATSLDGYCIEIESDFVAPIGFLRTLKGEDGRIATEKIEAGILGWQHVYRRGRYEPMISQLTKGQKKWEALHKRFQQEKSVTDREVWANALSLALLLGIFLRFLVSYPPDKWYHFAGMVVLAVIFLYWLLLVVSGFRCIERVRNADRALARIRGFWERYEQLYADCFTERYLREQTIGPVLTELKGEQGAVLALINDPGPESLQAVKPRPGNFYVRAVLMMVLIILVPWLMEADLHLPDFHFGGGESRSEADTAPADAAPADAGDDAAEPEPETEVRQAGFDENGFVFADSDARYLTADEVYELRNVEGYDFQTLLGFARNEIYARRGYAFRPDGQYYGYYMQYEWYSGIPHGDVGDDVFNEYELGNRDLILTIEQNEGFR